MGGRMSMLYMQYVRCQIPYSPFVEFYEEFAEALLS